MFACWCNKFKFIRPAGVDILAIRQWKPISIQFSCQVFWWIKSNRTQTWLVPKCYCSRNLLLKKNGFQSVPTLKVQTGVVLGNTVARDVIKQPKVDTNQLDTVRCMRKWMVNEMWQLNFDFDWLRLLRCFGFSSVCFIALRVYTTLSFSFPQPKNGRVTVSGIPSQTNCPHRP